MRTRFSPSLATSERGFRSVIVSLLKLMLWVGLGTRISLFAQGLLYIGLTAGLIMIKADDGVAWLAIHIALIAMALVLAKHNKLCILKHW